MLPRLGRLVTGLMMFSAAVCSQAPKGFRWVDFKREADAVSRVSEALRPEDYSAIREIGILTDSALVFTTEREAGFDTPEGDRWGVYSLSMTASKAHRLLSGYGLQIVAWLKFLPGERRDLGITYLTCYECEPATVFTAFHYDPKDGWRVRWPAKDPDGAAGIPLMYSDAGAPYSDEIVDQVWAVMEPPSGLTSVGTWYHSFDPKTGKVTSVVEKFLVDSADTEESLTLSGAEAAAWKRKLCRPTDAVRGLSVGQGSESCKRLFQVKRSARVP